MGGVFIGDCMGAFLGLGWSPSPDYGSTYGGFKLGNGEALGYADSKGAEISDAYL